MCGIAGFYDPSLSERESQELIAAMTATIAHRGPDFTGSWTSGPITLGHTRLSIIDLESHANQPFEYGGYMLSYNGEIYNYLEIRAELESSGYQFHTQSDTEVLIASYKHWGEACVERFIGMWAFAIWDPFKNQLFCSRDRFGIKPFYYIHKNGKFWFSSEYKPLKRTPAFSNNPNLDQVLRGIQLGMVSFGSETYYEDIIELPAAGNLIFRDGDIEIRRYWEPLLSQNEGLKDEDKAEKFLDLFLDSVKLQLRSDVEIGACLSGGLDSSSIVSAISKMHPEQAVKTFTIYYEGSNAVDERPWVNEVTGQYKNLQPYYYTPKEDEIREVYEACQYHVDVPLSGSSPVSQYLLMRLAAKHGIKVMLDGQGSDEYLAGYMHAFDRLIGGALKRMQLPVAIGMLMSHRQLHGVGAKKLMFTFAKSILAAMQDEGALLNIEYRRALPYSEKRKNMQVRNDLPLAQRTSRLNAFLYHQVFRTSLPTLLHYEDRNSMAWSIESRVPFLDHRLVDYCFTLPDQDKIRNGETKYILRKALKEILPPAITNRQDKKGFVTPGEQIWLKGPLKHLLEVDLKQLDFLNTNVVRDQLEAYRRGDMRNYKFIWRIATLAAWLRNA